MFVDLLFESAGDFFLCLTNRASLFSVTFSDIAVGILFQSLRFIYRNGLR
jgi:hypothetical protein